MATMTSKLVRVLSRQQHAANAGRREFSAMVTPTEEFPGIPATSPSAATASSATVTTLSNGLTVVSETASSTSTISLTYPNAGSSSESLSESGAALVNKFLAFQSGSGLSSAVIIRNLENAGATTFTDVNKTSATVGYTASKDQAIRLVPLLATTCEFAKWDVRDAQALAKRAAEDASSDAGAVISDSIFAAAFGAQSPLGKSVYGSAGSSSVGIQSFRSKTYGLNGAVLAATGIEDHDAFVKAVESGLSESYVGDAPVSAPSSPFLGGETRVAAAGSDLAHVALAFEAKGSSPLLNIVQKCIELSGEGVSSYSSAKTGLLGLYASSADGAAVADQLCSIMTSAPSADLIARAKNLAKGDALFSIDGGNDSLSLAGAMTDSVLESGSFGYSDVSAAYDAVSVDQVQALFTSLGGSTPALAAVGNLTSVPYHGSIATRFA
jgi:hypothetical protein